MPASWISSIGLGLAMSLGAPAPEPSAAPVEVEEPSANGSNDAPGQEQSPEAPEPVEGPGEVVPRESDETTPDVPGPPPLADPAIEWPDAVEPETADPAAASVEGDLSSETTPDEELGDDEFGDDADDEPWPEEFGDEGGDVAPLPDYDPLRDSPQAISARHWVRTGIVTLSAGSALVVGAVLFGVSDPNNLALGNSGQVDARNRAALTLGIPGALLIGTGITTLTIGKRRRRALAVDLQASRRSMGVGLRGRF